METTLGHFLSCIADSDSFSIVSKGRRIDLSRADAARVFPLLAQFVRRNDPEMTLRQHEVFEYIRNFRAAYGCSPTYDEVGRDLKVSKVTVLGHLKELERKGLVTREKNRSRSVKVVE